MGKLGLRDGLETGVAGEGNVSAGRRRVRESSETLPPAAQQPGRKGTHGTSQGGADPASPLADDLASLLSANRSPGSKTRPFSC